MKISQSHLTPKHNFRCRELWLQDVVILCPYSLFGRPVGSIFPVHHYVCCSSCWIYPWFGFQFTSNFNNLFQYFALYLQSSITLLIFIFVAFLISYYLQFDFLQWTEIIPTSSETLLETKSVIFRILLSSNILSSPIWNNPSTDCLHPWHLVVSWILSQFMVMPNVYCSRFIIFVSAIACASGSSSYLWRIFHFSI